MDHFIFHRLRLLVIGSMLSLLAVTVGFAQSSKVTISGKITTSEDGDVLVGATVTEKGTTNGTTGRQRQLPY